MYAVFWSYRPNSVIFNTADPDYPKIQTPVIWPWIRSGSLKLSEAELTTIYQYPELNSIDS